jgi:hypothetical protein
MKFRIFPLVFIDYEQKVRGGEGGIRTPDTTESLH